jgi:hypothetical protein
MSDYGEKTQSDSERVKSDNEKKQHIAENATLWG